MYHDFSYLSLLKEDVQNSFLNSCDRLHMVIHFLMKEHNLYIVFFVPELD